MGRGSRYNEINTTLIIIIFKIIVCEKRFTVPCRFPMCVGVRLYGGVSARFGERRRSVRSVYHGKTNRTNRNFSRSASGEEHRLIATSWMYFDMRNAIKKAKIRYAFNTRGSHDGALVRATVATGYDETGTYA